jgi:hypothetical protein
MLFCKNSTEKSDSRVSLLGRTLLRISVLPLLIAVFLLISGRAIVSQDHRQELRICFRPIRTTIIGARRHIGIGTSGCGSLRTSVRV